MCSTVMAGGDVVGRRPAAVHARRNRSRGPVVGIVGAATGAGRLLASRLAIRDDVRRVVAVDSIRGDVDGVTWRVLDVTDPALVSRLSGCDVVVHAAVDVGVADDIPARTRHNIRGTQTVLTASAAAG